MAVASFVYATAKRDFGLGVHNWTGQTFKVMLVTSAYAAVDTDEFVSAVAAAELSGTGYVGGFGGSGRKALANPTGVVSGSKGKFDADDLTWAAINAGTPAAAIVLREITNDAASKLIAYISAGFPKTTDGGNLVITWNAAGILLGV